MVFIVGTPALAFSPGLDEAQQNTVVGGVVVDKNNEPLIGGIGYGGRVFRRNDHEYGW